MTTFPKLQEVQISKNAEKILLDRYVLKTADGNLLEHSFADVMRRVARTIASKLLVADESTSLQEIKDTEEEFYYILAKRAFLPNSPTIFNAGKGVDISLLQKDIADMTLEDYKAVNKQSSNRRNMLSACFVQEIDDDMDSIFNAVHDAAITQKYGGGVGFNFSRLRPQDAPVGGTSGMASGPISFMQVINHSTEAVDQGGVRRGALMGILNWDHPDIQKFVTAKKDNNGDSVLKYFNISVGVTDSKKFLELLKDDGEIELKHPATGTTGKIRAQKLLHLMAEQAWKTGDPGLIKLDEINKYSAYDVPIEATNPCGEMPLPYGGSCNLGSIDVYKVQDYDSLRDVVKSSVKFLYLVVFGNCVPLPKQKQILNDYRPIGLGIMGFAKRLIKEHVRYGSNEAMQFAKELLEHFVTYTYETAQDLADRFGAFPKYEQSKHSDPSFIPWAANNNKLRQLVVERHKKNRKLCGVHLNTIAPTGTISMLADTSSGLEPEFMLSYTKTITHRDGSKEALRYTLPEVEEFLVEINEDEAVIEYVKEHGKLPEFASEEAKQVLVTSHDVTPEEHMLMLETFASYIDASVSKTINMPKNATVEDIYNIYKIALRIDGLKGITVYRDSSLETQVLRSVDDDAHVDSKNKIPTTIILGKDKKLLPKKVNTVVNSYTTRFKTHKSTTIVTLSIDENGEPAEVFVYNGGEKAEIIGRLMSIGLRSGIDANELIKQLRKSSGEFTTKVAEEIEKLIERAKNVENQTEINKQQENEELDFSKMTLVKGFYYVDEDGNKYCAHCHARNSISYEDGCITCKNCGASACTVS